MTSIIYILYFNGNFFVLPDVDFSPKVITKLKLMTLTTLIITSAFIYDISLTITEMRVMRIRYHDFGTIIL